MGEGVTHSPCLSSLLLCGGHGTTGRFPFTLSTLIDVGHLVLHTWEDTLDGSFIAGYLDAVMEAIDGRPQEEEGRNFSLPIHFLEDKQIFWRGGL